MSVTKAPPEEDDSFNMSDLTLEEVDTLEAVVIIDNELDPMSFPAPDTVQISGLMPSLATHEIDRGDAKREIKMNHICCSAHGLSILLVCDGSGGVPPVHPRGGR